METYSDVVVGLWLAAEVRLGVVAIDQTLDLILEI
jgi:hypothetical protein